MNANELYEMLKKAQEPKGYFFNQDKDHVVALLTALLEHKKLHGYMGCPCRLVCGDRDWDQDIICPCVYREEDVREFGSCYCNLYVKQEWNEGKIPHEYVPERRSVEKTLGPDI